MFEGEQFHQFLVSSRTTTTLSMIPLSFPLDHSSSNPNPNPNPTFNSAFDFTSSHQHQSNLILHHPHFLHHSPTTNSSEHELQQHQENTNTNTTTVVDPWSTNEVVALLRIRSSTSIDNWFPDFTWDLVSRKMGELGYKRSAENCKEKYEEEASTNLNGINKLNNKFLNISELEEQMFYQDHNADENDKLIDEEEQVDKTMKAKLQEDPKEKENIPLVDPHHPSDQERVVVVKPTKTKKRRSREDKFEMFKGFCVEIVHKMLAQQEEMHNKLIEDMVKRDEERIERDEAWKKQEMERVNKEIEIRAHEQISLGERQATMIELLNKFTPQKTYPLGMNFEDYLRSFTQPNNLSKHTENCALAQPEANGPTKKIAKVCEIRRKPLLSSSDKTKPENPKSTLDGTEDIGRRWPRDEVQALIDMRCSFHIGNINDDNNGGNKSSGGSVWEKISQGMAELGYSRSSKRCKEKWENINKYFRKTKDSNKKRSLDSRTCPYFHQLSSLYNQSTALSATSGEPVSHSILTENLSSLPDTTT